VFSEVCRDLDESDDMRAHFMAHVRIEVDEKLSVHANGRLYRPRGPMGRFTWDDPKHIPGCFKRFYVDPRDGILKKTPNGNSRWKRKEEQPEHGWLMDDGVQIKYIDGIWYEVSMTSRRVSRIIHPVIRNNEIIRPGRTILDTVYDYAKRQLNTRELKKYGIANNKS
jgi:hypothetical protein